jgi:cytochrome c peroxidase
MNDSSKIWRISSRHGAGTILFAVLLGSVFAACGSGGNGTSGADDDVTSDDVYQMMDKEVGGVAKFQFPTKYENLPLPQNTDGTPNKTLKITKPLVDLGRFLFADPALTTHVVTRAENPACSGDPSASEGGSCIACHFPAAGGGKAGQEIGINVGGEGLFIKDASGAVTVRRRVRPGFKDYAPTLVQQKDASGKVLNDGNCDQTDIVGRNPPQITVAGYNTRLLLGGLAGQPKSAPVNANPDDLPALLNIAQALRIVHRMNGDDQAIEPQGKGESQTLRGIPAYKLLFSRAYPELANGSIENLINSRTIFRATAAFMMASTLPRNAPFERFIAGNRGALTQAEMRGAMLFFKRATDGGAGCVSCHAGPSFNKQANDTNLSFVEENFINIGVEPNHIIAAQLTGTALGKPNNQDRGRGEVTQKAVDDFKFRVPTVLQLCGGTHFMHNAKFTKLRDVVKYFNDGVPQSSISGATADRRFTYPRGANMPRGLGLSDRQIDDLTVFMESGLCDPSLVNFDPDSTTEPLLPNMKYSTYDPELSKTPGVVDGMLPSGRPVGSNDALTRRDYGLEFLNVTQKITPGAPVVTNANAGAEQQDVVALTNKSTDIVDTHLIVVVRNLPTGVSMLNAEGITKDGMPYLRVYLSDGVLVPGNRMSVTLRFKRKTVNAPVNGYSLGFLSGQGNPRLFSSDGSKM